MSRCPECEKQARRQAAERRATGAVQPTETSNGRLVHFSDDERKRRSELAKRLHAEGQDLVVKAVESNLKGKNKPARLAAVREIRAMEKDQDERMARDRGGAVDPSGMTLEELEEFVVQGLESMMASGEISFADVELGDDAIQDVDS
jgi:hypothetical protein